MNKMDDEEVMTDDREKDRVYLEENEEDRERIEGKNPSISRLLRQSKNYANEEKALVERTKDWVYIGMGKVPLMERRFSKIYGRFH